MREGRAVARQPFVDRFLFADVLRNREAADLAPDLDVDRVDGRRERGAIAAHPHGARDHVKEAFLRVFLNPFLEGLALFRGHALQEARALELRPGDAIHDGRLLVGLDDRERLRVKQPHGQRGPFEHGLVAA